MGDRLSTLRILVVDDNPDGLEFVTRLLESHGASVVPAMDAATAFTIVETNPPHVIVSDISMPDEDGISLIRRVRELDRTRAGKIPAVALSGFASPEEQAAGILAGYQAFMPRPFESDELVLVLARLVGRGKW